MVIDLLISETRNHLQNIGYEIDNVDMNFIISGPNSEIESIIGVTLITELEEKVENNFNTKFDIFELITEMNNKNITLDFVAKEILKSDKKD